VCLLARATRAVEGRKSKGEARSGRTGARTESKSVKIGSHVQWLDDKVFLPRVFFHKATYAQSLQGDGSVHAAPRCEGPAQFAQFSTEKQRSTEKKKTREKTNFQKSQSEKEIRCTSTQQGNAWCWCLPGASQMRFTLSKSDFGEDGALQWVNKKSRLWDGVVTRGFIETSPFLFQWTGISTKLKEPAFNTIDLIRPPKSVTESTKNIIQRAEERFLMKSTRTSPLSLLTSISPNRIDRVILGARIKIQNKYLWYCSCLEHIRIACVCAACIQSWQDLTRQKEWFYCLFKVV